MYKNSRNYVLVLRAQLIPEDALRSPVGERGEEFDAAEPDCDQVICEIPVDVEVVMDEDEVETQRGSFREYHAYVHDVVQGPPHYYVEGVDPETNQLKGARLDRSIAEVVATDHVEELVAEDGAGTLDEYWREDDF